MTSAYIPEVLVGAGVTSEPGRSKHEWRNQRSFAAIMSDGSIVSWGSVSTDGDEEIKRFTESGPFQQIFSNRHAFAAVRHDGKLITWGNGGRGGEKRAARMILKGELSMFSRHVGHSLLSSLMVQL